MSAVGALQSTACYLKTSVYSLGAVAVSWHIFQLYSRDICEISLWLDFYRRALCHGTIKEFRLTQCCLSPVGLTVTKGAMLFIPCWFNCHKWNVGDVRTMCVRPEGSSFFGLSRTSGVTRDGNCTGDIIYNKAAYLLLELRKPSLCTIHEVSSSNPIRIDCSLAYSVWRLLNLGGEFGFHPVLDAWHGQEFLAPFASF